MRVKQCTFAPVKGVTAFLGKFDICQLTLGANELRTRGFAAFFQPVGKNQSTSVVIEIFGDRSEESGFVTSIVWLPCAWPSRLGRRLAHLEIVPPSLTNCNRVRCNLRSQLPARVDLPGKGGNAGVVRAGSDVERIATLQILAYCAVRIWLSITSRFHWVCGRAR